jgi:hypothetical protein
MSMPTSTSINSPSWLSQYPHEEEILFAPLTGLEIDSTRVSGALLVVEVRDIRVHVRVHARVRVHVRRPSLLIVEVRLLHSA